MAVEGGQRNGERLLVVARWDMVVSGLLHLLARLELRLEGTQIRRARVTELGGQLLDR
jgi:hypothetical protein